MYFKGELKEFIAFESGRKDGTGSNL